MTALRRIALGWAAAAAVLAAGACVFVLDDPSGFAAGVRRDLHRIVAFQPGGTLSLRHLDGDIEIRGWDRDEIEMIAESQAGDGLWNPGSGRPRFDIEESPERLTIRTRWEGDAAGARPVRIFLSVPRSLIIEEASTQAGGIAIADLYGQARVSILEGDLAVENFSGGLSAAIGRGRIRAEILDLRRGDEVSLTVREGDVWLALEPAVSAVVEAEAPDGVSADWDLPEGARQAKLKLGAGEASIAVKTGAGKIELRRTPETS